MYLVIVKRGDLQYYDMLYKAFSARMPVILDRRRIERRKASLVPETGERRTSDRRKLTHASWSGLGFVVVDK